MSERIDRINDEIKMCKNRKGASIKRRKKYRVLKYVFIVAAAFVEGFAWDYAEKIGGERVIENVEDNFVEYLEDLKKKEI